MERQKYDVAVSYASEQRPYVERFVARLQSQKMRVYYDRNAQAKMVGKILDQELHRIYLQESNCCILFLSNAYVEKPVTRYESQIILSENLFKENFMYIFKFDDVTLPGLNRNFVYSSAAEFPEPEAYSNFIYEVIRGKKPKDDSGTFLYESLADGLVQIAAHPNTSLRFALTGSPISCSYVCDPGLPCCCKSRWDSSSGKAAYVCGCTREAAPVTTTPIRAASHGLP